MTREELHQRIVDILREQDYGHAAQPSATGMAWAIVNGIEGER